MKRISIISLVCLLSTNALAIDRYKISVVRMFDRSTADLSYKFFGTRARDSKDFVDISITGGLGIVVWDYGPNEGRLHADWNMGINSVRFSIGSFITSGTMGAAVGLRTSYGYQFLSRASIGGYWELTAGLPFSHRGTRAGIGIQAGFSF
jgi:hypothetical protein